MEGERERLNHRISALTEKLADAKFANSVEAFTVRAFTILHFKLQAEAFLNILISRGGGTGKGGATMTGLYYL